MEVSTPDLPAPPPLAAAVFGDRLPLATRYATWLAGAGVERGLVGPRETERLWDRHLLNCAAIGALIPPHSTVIDIGSGAGLPGVALAIARPDLTVVLVESMLRRTAFLSEVVADLRCSGVSVRRARAEELPAKLSAKELADVVTARAVAPIDKLARWALPLAKSKGVVLALKGEGAAEEVSAGWPALRRNGVAEARLVSLVASSATAYPSAASQGSASPAVAPSAARESSLGIQVEELGSWPGSPPDREARGTDPVAVVVALSRFPQPLSREAGIGLG